MGFKCGKRLKAMSFYHLVEKVNEYLELPKSYRLSNDEKINGVIELASVLLEIQQAIETDKEISLQKRRHSLCFDRNGLDFLVQLTDKLCRSTPPKKLASQIALLVSRTGIPNSFSSLEKIKLSLFKLLSPIFYSPLINIAKKSMHKEFKTLIIDYNEKDFDKTLQRLSNQGITININHLGEEILGEEHASQYVSKIINSIENHNINSISIKLSSLYSQLSPISWKETQEIVIDRLRKIFETALNYPFFNAKNQAQQKLIYIDMESHRELNITIDCFIKALSHPKFKSCKAGICLQAYIPDSFESQKKLTDWAIKRTQKGGTPIQLRLVKGANLGIEKIISATEGWIEPIYDQKASSDANFKRMIQYAFQPKHAQSVHIGVGTHNLFDIAFVLLERSEKNVEQYVSFELLYGMAETTRKTLKLFTDNVLVYCPVVEKTHTDAAIAYLIRRFEENSNLDHFLPHSYLLKFGSEEWEKEATRFSLSYKLMTQLESLDKKRPSRQSYPLQLSTNYSHHPHTDWSHPNNSEWGAEILSYYQNKTFSKIPLGLSKNTRRKLESLAIHSPSSPSKVLYHIEQLPSEMIESVFKASEDGFSTWKTLRMADKIEYFTKLSQKIQENRNRLIGVIMAAIGKPLAEADAELCEGIDFIHYYCDQALSLINHTNYTIEPKGPTLVLPPWNFPFSITLGQICATLLMGNSVLLKPSPKAGIIAWELCKLCWAADIPKTVLQFIPCDNNTVGTALIKHPKLAQCVLTGSTRTAKTILQTAPKLDLIAETGGKNTIIVSSSCDQDEAIQAIIESAFSFSGQKCSAASVIILDANLYDNTEFLHRLKDATESLIVGSQWQQSSVVTPLIGNPYETHNKLFTETEEEESWLVEPHQHHENNALWSPGIKVGITEDSSFLNEELFAPIIGIIRAHNFQHALSIVNRIPYGLTAGLMTLDEEEQKKWLASITVGNYYINRPITGAIVNRQPFGGVKESSFGLGFKAGGPFYLHQFAHINKEESLPNLQSEFPKQLSRFQEIVKPYLTREDYQKWRTFMKHCALETERLTAKTHERSILGEENIYFFRPHSYIIFRITKETTTLDQAIILGCFKLTRTPFELSVDTMVSLFSDKDTLLKTFSKTPFHEESENTLLARLPQFPHSRIRQTDKPGKRFLTNCHQHSISVIHSPISNSPVLEVAYLMSETSVSRKAHRHGNVSLQESHPLKIPKPIQSIQVPIIEKNSTPTFSS